MAGPRPALWPSGSQLGRQNTERLTRTRKSQLQRHQQQQPFQRKLLDPCLKSNSRVGGNREAKEKIQQQLQQLAALATKTTTTTYTLGILWQK